MEEVGEDEEEEEASIKTMTSLSSTITMSFRTLRMILADTTT